VINAGELRKGLTIELDGELFNVVDYSHNKTGRGGALVRLKLNNLKSGYNVEKTFSASEKFKRVYLEHRKVQYLYHEDSSYVFMDTETFDQFPLSTEQMGDDMNYLKENMLVDVLMYNDQPIGVELPITVELEVIETEPGFKGDTASGGNKPAIVETGLKVMVPLFVNQGDVIRVDTRNGSYLERA